ncbi:MAG: class I SAM-dependent methyltransferase [Anaerolineae bacterium]|nr:class I SAM-dependent methyltransferase [Anaerolineae bacterium]
MSLRYHEIAEAEHRILNPFTEAKLMHLGEICRLRPGMRQLDLACGQGEMLCRWAEKYGITGTGVDISTVFTGIARKRAEELGVADKVEFVCTDANGYTEQSGKYDIVSCIGATWIGGGTVGTIEQMKKALKDPHEGLLLVGEVYWRETPTAEACRVMGFKLHELVGLGGMPGRFAEAGAELIEMIIAAEDDWDRYEAKQWWQVFHWLRANPDDPDAAALKEWTEKAQYKYLNYERRYCGWGVFVLKVKT